MNSNENCDWKGCMNKPGPHHFIHGEKYCIEHYALALEKRFLEEYERTGSDPPSRRFLNLFSRYVESAYSDRYQEMPAGLTKGKLGNRTGSFRKTKKGLSFCIERHPYAFTAPEKMYTTRQRWFFNLRTKKLRLLKEI